MCPGAMGACTSINKHKSATSHINSNSISYVFTKFTTTVARTDVSLFPSITDKFKAYLDCDSRAVWENNLQVKEKNVICFMLPHGTNCSSRISHKWERDGMKVNDVAWESNPWLLWRASFWDNQIYTYVLLNASLEWPDCISYILRWPRGVTAEPSM